MKNINVKVFNLVSKTNEARHIKWHETCKCKCRLDTSVCNNKQRWNKDKCRCKCKKLIDKGVCGKGFICNPSNCERECNKSCDTLLAHCFVYYKYMNHNKENVSRYDYVYQPSVININGKYQRNKH